VQEVYLGSRWPGDSLGAQLEFALKYDGVSLDILSEIFRVAAREDVAAYVLSRPLGKYARRAWYLYELLTGDRLPIDDATSGNYVDLLDADDYYTAGPRRIRRQRINDNLLGGDLFCPMVRRTDTLKSFENADLAARGREIRAEFPREILKRALSYLYTKETRSSFAIENVKPDSTRTGRFVQLLQSASETDFLQKDRLIDLQNRIVDERYRDHDYRTDQNYVGETVAWQRERIHYVSPRPADLPGLMEGLTTSHERMATHDVDPVVHAGAVAYGFVFLHPFGDGNGRIHRFLIHNVLAMTGFTPADMIFPVSAAMLSDWDAYDDSLEAFSRPLMPLIAYDLDEDGRMTVTNQTAAHYRFPDMTPQVEALYGFVQHTIEVDLVQELEFLQGYDRAKRSIREIADIPDREIDLLIRFCRQNQGRLSPAKRKSRFSALTDGEVAKMEQAVREAYGVDRRGGGEDEEGRVES